MASADKKSTNKTFFESRKHFPEANDRINVVQFLEAASYLVDIIDCFGNLFSPVKYDIQANIDKIKKQYTFDENSCLLELMLDEIKRGQNIAVEGVLWLNRSLWMFELTFQEMIKHLQANNHIVSMKTILIAAYEGSVKQYHNWVIQQAVYFMCKMSSTLPEMMKKFQADNDVKGFESALANYNITLHSVRCKIDDFFIANKLFKVSK